MNYALTPLKIINRLENLFAAEKNQKEGTQKILKQKKEYKYVIFLYHICRPPRISIL
jgi:hypothetical protein